MDIRKYKHVLLIALVALLLGPGAYAKGFSFSATEAQEESEEQQVKEEAKKLIEKLLATPCSKGLKNRKTAVIIAERTTKGGYETNQSSFGLHATEINRRLRDLGLRTYSPKEIMAQIQAAEIAAFMNNDPDAQISAASRLGASFTLRGLIESRVTHNTVANVNEVHITMTFTLITSSGKTVANVSEEAESYAGSDTSGIALSLVREKAGLVVAKLYSEYCQNAK
jgi:hypothetical protein